MTDENKPENPHYKLAKRIDHAREVADTSLNRADHALYQALQGVADAEIYSIERQVHDEVHGIPDPATFASWSEVSRPGTLDWPDEWHGFDPPPD
jgi:hypothetical protein